MKKAATQHDNHVIPNERSEEEPADQRRHRRHSMLYYLISKTYLLGCKASAGPINQPQAGDGFVIHVNLCIFLIKFFILLQSSVLGKLKEYLFESLFQLQ